MAKINFTPEHKKKMEELAVFMLFNGVTFSGFTGSKITVYDLVHNVTLNTLSILYGNLKKDVDRISELDEWSLTEHQQKKQNLLKKQQDFVNLLIGYKKFQAQKQSDKAKLSELLAKREEIKASSMTPSEQIAALDKQIEELKSDDETEDSEADKPAKE